MSNLISCVSWVRRGVAARHPSKYALDEEELQRVSALARIEVKDVRTEYERAHKAAQMKGKGAEFEEAYDHDADDDSAWVDENSNAMDMDQDEESASPEKADDLTQYQLDKYDDEAVPETRGAGPFSNIKGLTYYRDNEEDPYITLKEEDEDERDDLEVLPTDNLIVVAKTEDEISQLEVYVYDESQGDLYIHHDLMLPNLPLCLEWLNFPPASSSKSPDKTFKHFGNYIAVGTLDPEIEIWSLDTVETMYPDMVLGRPDETAAHIPIPVGMGKKKRKKTKNRPVSEGHHVDAVLGLSWNKTHRNILASASADRTVKLWDLSRDPTSANGGAIRSFGMHKDKVQAVQWNPKEPTILLTGSYDRTVRTFDSRSPDAGVGAVVGADVEAIRWDPWEGHIFYVSLENGIVLNFDARALSNELQSASPSLFTLAAHDGAASALDVNPHIRGCLCTGGTDKMVKVWNVDSSEGGKPHVSMVASRNLEVGKVFSAIFSPDDALTLAAAGSKAKVQIWDLGANAGARNALASKLAEAGQVLKEKEGMGVIGIVDDDENESEDE